MVKGRLISVLAAEVVARHFAIASGVSPQQGGGDEGPDPHELLEAALSACTIITAQMYANRKGMKLESTIVAVKVESESPEASSISREIAFVGDLSEDERKRLLEIANKCPIHRLLESKVSIETRLAEV